MPTGRLRLLPWLCRSQVAGDSGGSGRPMLAAQPGKDRSHLGHTDTSKEPPFAPWLSCEAALAAFLIWSRNGCRPGATTRAPTPCGSLLLAPSKTARPASCTSLQNALAPSAGGHRQGSELARFCCSARQDASRCIVWPEIRDLSASRPLQAPCRPTGRGPQATHLERFARTPPKADRRPAARRRPHCASRKTPWCAFLGRRSAR